MAKSAYHYIANVWNERSDEMVALMRERLIKWRREPVVVRVETPTRLDRARALGYRSKQGFIVVRVKVRKGGLNRPRPNSGRRPKRMGVYGYAPAKSTQLIAEERANDKYPNLEVLGSYYVGEDGIYKYFEVILIDPHHQAVKSDPDVSWIAENQHSGRVYRGKTSSGRKMRGLLGNRGLRGTHKWKWRKKMKERLLGRRHEASRGARLIVPKDLFEDLNLRK